MYQAEKVKRAPKGPRKPKEKKAGGGGLNLSAPSLSAPSIGVPQIGSGPFAAFPYIIGSLGLCLGAGFVASNVDDEFMDFINEAMAKDTTTFTGTETDLKQ